MACKPKPPRKPKPKMTSEYVNTLYDLIFASRPKVLCPIHIK